MSRGQAIPVANEPLARLKTLFVKECDIDLDVFNWIADPGTCGCASVSDFAGLFTTNTYEAAVQDDILAKMTGGVYANNRIQMSRLRLAWRLATAETTGTMRKRETGDKSEQDWDAPLDSDVRQQQETVFYDAYHFSLESDIQAADPMFARLYKEFRKWVNTVYPLQKVKTASQWVAVMSHSKEKKHLGGGWSISKDSEAEIPDTDFQSPLSFLYALQVLCFALAQTGTEYVDSKIYPNTRVRVAELTECLAYYVFVQEKAISFPGSGTQCVEWLLERDRQTRAKARSLFLDKYPYGEALRLARETHCAVLWTCGNVKAVGNPVPVITNHSQDGEQSPKRPRREEHGSSVVSSPGPSPQPRYIKCCPAFNGDGCSAKKAKECPDKLAHTCSFRLRDGKQCGAWQHGAKHCPSNPKRVAGNNSQKKRGHKGQSKGGKR